MPRPTPPPVAPTERTLTNSIGMQLVLIEPGEFLMGTPETEEGREINEGPQHRVRITKPFFLGAYEVTQSQYETVMGTNPAKFKGTDQPVESVSWEEAVEFCRKLSTREGRTYRLPTEAEWEYACRAGTTTAFAFGATISSDRDANFNGNQTYGNGVKGRYLEKTVPVGSYRANGCGLYDLHGNVWEWCSDWYGADYYAYSPMNNPSGPATTTEWEMWDLFRESPVNPPSGLATASNRVIRGGSWDNFARNCRSALRIGFAPSGRGGDLGFRVALVPLGQ